MKKLSKEDISVVVLLSEIVTLTRFLLQQMWLSFHTYFHPRFSIFLSSSTVTMWLHSIIDCAENDSHLTIFFISCVAKGPDMEIQFQHMLAGSDPQFLRINSNVVFPLFLNITNVSCVLTRNQSRGVLNLESVITECICKHISTRSYAVVSWPPPWLPVLTKSPAGFPANAWVFHNDPVASKKALNWAAIMPYRVGKPNKNPSAAGKSLASRTGTSDFGGACIFPKTSSGKVSAT